MEKTSYHNLFAIITGVVLLLTCASISYYFQKKLFSKYRLQTGNIVSKKQPDEL